MRRRNRAAYIAIEDRQELGKLDLYKAPHVKSSAIELTGLFRLFTKKLITFNDLTPPHDP
ncbi:hypothetical protein [Vulcanisaeta thermophila]|uniref:hypothetical protein n=1 Tax=Vulcanisaeta thermophila TaxID=867917 RepID=UPI000AC04863|nr:hypothetical protein [Vulcanisaeta thermophila]